MAFRVRGGGGEQPHISAQDSYAYDYDYDYEYGSASYGGDERLRELAAPPSRHYHDFWTVRRTSPQDVHHDVPMTMVSSSSGRATPVLRATSWTVDTLPPASPSSPAPPLLLPPAPPPPPPPPPPPMTQTTWTGGSHLKASFADPPPPSGQWFLPNVAAHAPPISSHAELPSPWRPVQSYADWQREREDLMFANASLAGSSSFYQQRQRQRLRQHFSSADTTPDGSDVCCSGSGGGGASLSLSLGNEFESVGISRSSSSSGSSCHGGGNSGTNGTSRSATRLWTDDEAAASVSRCLSSSQRRNPGSRHARILLGLIHPKSPEAEFRLDNCALESIFLAANEIFFSGRLTHRVRWGWSDAAVSPSSSSSAFTSSSPPSGTASGTEYDGKIIGHTALRPAKSGGFETFILLSTPILCSPQYNRRLLISAFLHELIHCYLFICCGWRAREAGGHTAGFRAIADTIDRWAGREHLHLCRIEADLDRFRQIPHKDDYASPFFGPHDPLRQHPVLP